MRTEREFLDLIEAKLQAQAPSTPRFSARRAVLVALTAVVLVTVTVVGVAMLRDRGGEIDRGEIKIEPAIEIGWPEDDPPPVPWSQSYAGAEYSLNSRDPLPIAPGDLGADLGGGLYALDGVTTDYFVLYAEDGQYWGYVNYAYRPATLGDLVADLSLDRYLTFGDMHISGVEDGEYRRYRVEGLHDDHLRSLLFASPTAAPQRLTVHADPTAIETQPGEMVTPPYDPSGQYLFDRTVVADWSVAISLPKLGFHNISIMAASEADGDWLWTNLLAHGNYFAAPDLVERMFAYARANGTWIDTTPDLSDAVTAPAVAE